MTIIPSARLLLLPAILGLVLFGCGSAAPSVPSSPPAAASGPMTQAAAPSTRTNEVAQPTGVIIRLPEPKLKSDASLEETLAKRRSVRQYADAPLQLSEVSQLLWAAQGITDSKGGRTAPSAVASYPLEVYLVAGRVNDLAKGAFLYLPQGHELSTLKDGDLRKAIGTQGSITTAPVDIVIVATYDRTKRFGDNSIKWACLEAGHVAQNICLEATALGLGTVTIGGFDEQKIVQALGLSGNRGVLYVLPVGKRT